MPGRADSKLIVIFAKMKFSLNCAFSLKNVRRHFDCNPTLQTAIPGAEQQANAAVAKEAGSRRRRP
jgi:hypothetical protein